MRLTEIVQRSPRIFANLYILQVPAMATLILNAARDGNVDELRSLLLEATKEDVNFQHPEVTLHVAASELTISVTFANLLPNRIMKQH